MKRRLLVLAIMAVGLLLIAAQCPLLGPGDTGPTQPPGSQVPDPTPQPPAGPCDCTGEDLDCGDFSTDSAARACFDYCKSLGYGDVFGLAGDDDSDPCESLRQELREKRAQQGTSTIDEIVQTSSALIGQSLPCTGTPNWVAALSGLGGIIVGAYLTHLLAKRRSAKRENFDREVIRQKQEEDRKVAEWQEEAKRARATIGSVRRPGGEEVPKMPSPTELKPSPNGWLRRLFRKGRSS